MKFNYKLAKRAENGYIKGLKIEKVELLDNIEVKTNNLLFKRYQISHVADSQLGYERVSQLQEFNSADEPANPVVFDYQTTVSNASNSEKQTTYYNNLDFSSIELSGDFDGDGILDFATENKLYRGVFQGSSGLTPINLPASLLNESGFNKFTATTNSQNKLNQFQSFVNVIKNNDNNTTEFKIFDFDGSSIINSYNKTVDIPNTGVYGDDIEEYIQCPTNDCIDTVSMIPNLNYSENSDGTQNYYYNACNHNKPLINRQKYYEGDFNGDGISEVFIVNEEVTRHKKYTNYVGNNGGQNCNTVDVVENVSYYILNLDSNKTTILGSEGYVKLANTVLLNSNFKFEERFVNDYNGDGKSDIFVISKANENFGEYKIYSFNQLLASPWFELELIGNGVIDRYSPTKQLLFGDYNADGKLDIMIPDSEGGPNDSLWHIYYSNPNPIGGSFFVKESHNIVEYWPNTGSYYSTQTHFSNYYALDINKDGKTDLVRVWRNYYKPSWTINDHNTQWQITTFVNNTGNTQVARNKFTADYTSPCQQISTNLYNCNHDNDSPDIPIPVASSFKYAGLNNQIVMVRNHHNELTYINFTKDVAKDIRISKVTSSGGNIVDEIEYNTMESSNANNGQGTLNEFYSSSNSLNYPFVELKRLPTNYLVSKITNTVDGVTKSQDFRYNGLIVNLHGLGIVGFKKTARSAWYQNYTAKRIWNVSENRADWRGGLERSYSQLLDNGSSFTFINSGNPSGIISSTVNDFQSSTVNGIYKLSLTSQTSKDFLTNVSAQTSYLYDANYLLPTTVTTKNFTTDINNPDGTKVTTTVFLNNPTGVGSAYYIGRPLETSSTVSAYGNTNSTKEIYSYLNNKISKIEKRGNTNNSNFLVEDFEYDIYGNVKKKTLSSSGYVAPQSFAPRVTEFTYDTTQRFVKTTKDIEGLISTNVSYHPIYGVVTESTNPYGLSTKTFFDNWGKVIKVTDYLGKSVDITYSKSNGEYTTTKVGEDGSSSIEISDALARSKKSGSKNIDGTWSYKNTEYDFLGRNYRNSEPYNSGNPTQWNTNNYDDYGRLIKTTSSSGLITNISHNGLTVTATDGIITKSSTKNANGHVVVTTDNGGTITFKYYADGNLKESNYNGTVIKMEYDEWGRKTKLDDPSAGIYTYSYNALGESITETTPNEQQLIQTIILVKF